MGGLNFVMPQRVEVANCWLAVQSKARSQLRETETEVKYNCTRKDLEYWMLGNQPVILVVSIPDQKKAWWVSVKDYFRERDIKNERTIIFDKDRSLLTPSTAEKWKVLGSQYGAGDLFCTSPNPRNSNVQPYQGRTICLTDLRCRYTMQFLG